MKDTLRSKREEILDANVIYHQLFAAVYDAEQTLVSKRYAQRFFLEDISALLSAAGKPPSEVRVLDCGAGTGNLSLKFLERGCHVVGVDISADMVSRLQEKLPTSWSSRFELHVRDIDSFLENDERQFDIVCSSSFLHHLPDYRYTYRLMAKRCARAGQIYTAVEPRGDNNLNALQQLFTQADERLYEIRLRKLYNPFVLLPKVVRRLTRKKSDEVNPYTLVDVSKVEDTSEGINMERLREIASEEGFHNFKIMARCIRRTAFTTWIDRKLVRTNGTLFAIAS